MKQVGRSGEKAGIGSQPDTCGRVGSLKGSQNTCKVGRGHYLVRKVAVSGIIFLMGAIFATFDCDWDVANH